MFKWIRWQVNERVIKKNPKYINKKNGIIKFKVKLS